ncbi:UDP-glucose/GDP-mannose dehydrogenase family protein [Rossellomorea aquimaris]|uniref:UDP-glucose dehydrogenase family protein n=1 Tax=Rossellomorea aquimaris TaxID=189382 RepID=UPI001CD54E4A|nr:UDP-glucose/GDP-mannose dehydrogenase family protein [Rossellomorea aquimaris]MCA1055241.1 UDP-glucose/GDP-mannose dehydrogenase family protein [Rossellomorea aquimaris]
MKVTVIGAGYVGLVTGASLSEISHDVTVLDIDEERVNLLKSGRSPLYENGLDELIQKQLEKGTISFTTLYRDAIPQAEVIILAVGTPSNDDGTCNLSAVEAAANAIGSHLTLNDTIIVTKSTVPVGTNQKIKEWIMDSLTTPVHFSVASIPEFLREGSALQDTFQGDRIVIGTESEGTASKLEEMVKPFQLPTLHTSIESAEMIKYASNAFLATKISFINEIASLCEKTGGNIEDVARGMGMDHRIGPHFLQAGIGYGGSCFPKDTKALVQLAGNVEHSFDLLESVIHVNAGQRVKLVQKAKEHFTSLKGKKAGILGLSFKPGTDDIREAASIEIINELVASGVDVTVYDPVAMQKSERILGELVSYGSHVFDAIEDQDMLFIVTEWEEFKLLRLKTIGKLMKHPVVFDGRNCFSLDEAREAEVEYHSIGRPSVSNLLPKKI